MVKSMVAMASSWLLRKFSVAMVKFNGRYGKKNMVAKEICHCYGNSMVSMVKTMVAIVAKENFPCCYGNATVAMETPWSLCKLF